MLFSSMIFLWLFLPLTFIFYNLLDNKFKNLFLLLVSLLFYAWGEPKATLIMLFSITINYFSGILISKQENKKLKILFLIINLIINFAILGYYKYYNFFIDSFNSLFGQELLKIKNVILPIGISFFTFQNVSYILDLYFGKIKVQKNYVSLALYISFFPQLIAGPIVKYHDIDKQINKRDVSFSKIVYGIKRFIYGLAKKVIISNSLALVVDNLFNLNPMEFGTTTSWFVIILYSFQIYFDFSGYSDMAIGLGKMFGFDFLENFNYPYIAKSITDFWRRWHMSLSTWFKEYLYIPLGGNRKGKFRTYSNLLIVFFATGLWHGASWNFVVWGLFHGLFMILERLFLGEILKKNKWKFINHLYVLLVVLIGWVFFRTNNLNEAFHIIKTMFIPTNSAIQIKTFINSKIILIIIIALLTCGPIQIIFKNLKKQLYNENKINIIETIFFFSLLFICIILLVNNTYNPFIYFRF